MEFHIFGRVFYLFAEDRQKEKFVNFMNMYFHMSPWVAVLFAVVLIYSALFIFAKFRNKVRMRELLGNSAAWVYLFAVICFSVLNREWGAERAIRLTTFSLLAGETGFHESRILYVLMGIMAFIPYGFLVQRAMKRKFGFLYTLCIAVLSGLFIEVLKYVLATSDSSVESVVRYAVGSCIGALIAVLLKKIHKEEDIK